MSNVIIEFSVFSHFLDAAILMVSSLLIFWNELTISSIEYFFVSNEKIIFSSSNNGCRCGVVRKSVLPLSVELQIAQLGTKLASESDRCGYLSLE